MRRFRKGGGRGQVSLREGILRSLEAAGKSESVVSFVFACFFQDPKGETEPLAGFSNGTAAKVDKGWAAPGGGRGSVGFIERRNSSPDLLRDQRSFPLGCELLLCVAVGETESVLEQPRGDRVGVGVSDFSCRSRCCCCCCCCCCFSGGAPDVAEVFRQGMAPFWSLGLVGERAAGVGGVGADLGIFYLFDRGVEVEPSLAKSTSRRQIAFISILLRCLTLVCSSHSTSSRRLVISSGDGWPRPRRRAPEEEKGGIGRGRNEKRKE